MDNKLIEYQELDKKLIAFKKQVLNGETQKQINALNAVIKQNQTKVLELEEKSKLLLAELNKLNEVEKKGIAFVEKLNNMSIDSMSEDELNDFNAKASQTADQLAELNSRIINHSQRVKRVVFEYKTYRSEILNAKKKRDELKTKVEEEMKKNEPAVNKIKKEMAELEKSIKSSIIAKYRTMKQDGIFPVVVPLVDKRCGGCRMELSVSALDQLKNGGLYECEQCRRLIFLDKD